VSRTVTDVYTSCIVCDIVASMFHAGSFCQCAVPSSLVFLLSDVGHQPSPWQHDATSFHDVENGHYLLEQL
jgi:hypothetical protein